MQAELTIPSFCIISLSGFFSLSLLLSHLDIPDHLSLFLLADSDAGIHVCHASEPVSERASEAE